jgi:hypothetical protein
MSQERKYRSGGTGKGGSGEQAEFTTFDAGDTSKLEEALKQAAAKEQRLQPDVKRACEYGCSCPPCIRGDCGACLVDTGAAGSDKYR